MSRQIWLSRRRLSLTGMGFCPTIAMRRCQLPLLSGAVPVGQLREEREGARGYSPRGVEFSLQVHYYRLLEAAVTTFGTSRGASWAQHRLPHPARPAPPAETAAALGFVLVGCQAAGPPPLLWLGAVIQCAP